MSQNVRQNSGGITRSNGNNNGNTYANPFDGGAQSKASAAAGFVPQQQPVGFVPQQVTSYSQPQQVAQAVMQTMPGYGG